MSRRAVRRRLMSAAVRPGATFYKYEAKFCCLDSSNARKPKASEDENAKLKTLLAEATGQRHFEGCRIKNGDAPLKACCGGHVREEHDVGHLPRLRNPDFRSVERAIRHRSFDVAPFERR